LSGGWSGGQPGAKPGCAAAGWGSQDSAVCRCLRHLGDRSPVAEPAAVYAMLIST